MSTYILCPVWMREVERDMHRWTWRQAEWKSMAWHVRVCTLDRTTLKKLEEIETGQRTRGWKNRVGGFGWEEGERVIYAVAIGRNK
jgi:hypothetical protein